MIDPIGACEDVSFELMRIAFPGTGLSALDRRRLDSEPEFAVLGVFGGTSSSSVGQAPETPSDDAEPDWWRFGTKSI